MEKTLIIFIDGLGYDLLKKSAFSFNPNVKIFKFIPCLGYSSAVVPTIWSGGLPQKTRRWSEFKYDPLHSPFRWLGFLPLQLLDTLSEKLPARLSLYFDYALRKIIKSITGKLFSIPFLNVYQVPFSKLKYFSPNYKQIHQLNSLQGQSTLFDILNARGVKYCYIGYPEVRRDFDVYKKSKQALRRYEVIISCFTQLDSIEHRYGKESKQIEKKLNQLKHLVNELISTFKKSNPQGNLVIFSDHGMSSVDKTIDLISIIDRSGLEDGVNFLSFYDATMARFWFFDQEAEGKLREQLEQVKSGRILEQAELQKFGLDFKDRLFGDLIFLVEQGNIILPNYFQGRATVKAMHGYDSIYSEQHAFFATDKDIGLKTQLRAEEAFGAMLKIIDIDFKKG